MDSQLKKGVLELCVLSLISRNPCYGYQLVSNISKHIIISEGTIYPLLRRLKKDGLVTTYLAESSGGPSRKYYKLTPVGYKKYESQQNDWYDFIYNVNNLLKGGEEDE